MGVSILQLTRERPVLESWSRREVRRHRSGVVRDFFRSDGSGNTSVLFNTPNAGIRLEPGGDIEIRAASLTAAESESEADRED